MSTIIVTDEHKLKDLVESCVSRALTTNLKEIEQSLKEARELALLQKGILTRNALCDLLDVSVDTIRRYEDKGLRVYRPGRSPLYLLEDVTEFIKQFPDNNLKLAA